MGSVISKIEFSKFGLVWIFKASVERSNDNPLKVLGLLDLYLV